MKFSRLVWGIGLIAIFALVGCGKQQTSSTKRRRPPLVEPGRESRRQSDAEAAL